MLKKEDSSTLNLKELDDALPHSGPNYSDPEFERKYWTPYARSFNARSFKAPPAQPYKPSAPMYDPSTPYKPPTVLPSAESDNPSVPSCEPLLYAPPNFEPPSSSPYFRPSPPGSLVPQDPFGEGWLFGKVGLHCYNLLNGTDLFFLYLDKDFRTGLFYKEILLNAWDSIRDAASQLLTRVVPSEFDKVCMRFMTTFCILLPDETHSPCDFDELAVDDFFKGDMPNWMPEDACDNLQYYELKESEVEENIEWLRMYSDLAFYTKLHLIPSSREWRGPYELTKVIVQTREDVESEKKVMAKNAIFYISIKTCHGYDCYATIRRTMDGMPGHLSLEVKCLM